MRDPLARRAAATPDRLAVIDPAGERASFADLDREVAEIAGHLAGHGVSNGDHLGAVLTDARGMLTLTHAAMRLGCCLVPLNPTVGTDALAAQTARSDIDAIVCEEATEESTRSIDVDRTIALDPSETVPTIDESAGTDVTSGSWDPADPMLLLFTSGTTGNPKAVTLTMGNLLSSAMASATRLGVLPDDRWLSPLPPYHMGGIAPFYRSAFYGTAVVLPESVDPDPLAETAHREAVTGISLVPTLLNRLLESSRELPTSLRFVLLGGGRIPPELVETALDRGVPVYPTYGLTEAASQVTTATPDEAQMNPETAGRPLVVTDVTIVDDTGSPVGAGETGEIVVDGPTVTPGYYGDSTASAEAFGPYGFHTGDRGQLDGDGRLTVSGRRTDRIVTGGENVDPHAVGAVVRSVPGVDEVAVIGIPDPEWGERVAALVVSDPDATVTADAIDEHCRAQLAAFERPRSVSFADTLPRTPSGTVDRDAVRRRLTE